ncbi:ATP-binding protein [Frondihabitans australicus]|uniref:Signal transduction histidine kinase n=1 Tax=Frondihabitans australicus TaxID=386892 RepID=A0A495IJY7_9MICO|nr:ATP-binding protein [Frondihabitans australicus]RKR76109.1 signal transduction histidine kinase [Frondihabitans australicus]
MTTLGVRRALGRADRRIGAETETAVRHADEGGASERILRVLYLAVGIGGLVYSAVGLGKTLTQLPLLTPWFGWGGWIFTSGCPLILAALALWAPLRVMRWIGSIYGIVFLLLLVLWPTQQISVGLPHLDSPWTNDILTVPAIAVAISWRTRPLWVYVILSAALSGYVRAMSDPAVGARLAALDATYNLLMNCTFAALVVVTRQSAARQDAAAVAARLETSREAEASARVQQRVRIDALVHDHVLSALLIASRPAPASRDALRALAASTLDTLRDESPLGAEPLTDDDFVSRLRSSVTSQSDGIRFVTQLDGAGTVPADIAQALLEAAAEAVRNTLRHAKPRDGAAGVLRTVTVSADPQGVEIGVADDGQGFNSRRIPPERLGVRVSILSRMETIDGGFAAIESSRGVGTAVTIGWRAGAERPAA